MLHALYHFFIGDIPWWLYVAAALAAGVAIIIEVPGRLGVALGVAATVSLSAVGFTAKGYEEGMAYENAQWEAKAAAERKRLADAMDRAQRAEDARDKATTDFNTLLQKEADNAAKAIDANGNPADCVLPGGLTQQLYDLGRDQRGSGNGAASGAKRPGGIPLLLHKLGGPAKAWPKR
jgi:hypothetical protein